MENNSFHAIPTGGSITAIMALGCAIQVLINSTLLMYDSLHSHK